MAIRNSVKIVLLNDENKILLMKTDDKSIKGSDKKYNGHFWQLIGGGIEKGETIEQAMKRELFEETSIDERNVTFGPIVWHATLDLIIHGVLTHIIQSFVLAKTLYRDINLDNLTMEEKFTVKELRWFSIEEIINCEEIIYPILLPQYLKPLIDGNIPNETIEIDLTKTK